MREFFIKKKFLILLFHTVHYLKNPATSLGSYVFDFATGGRWMMGRSISKSSCRARRRRREGEYIIILVLVRLVIINHTHTQFWGVTVTKYVITVPT